MSAGMMKTPDLMRAAVNVDIRHVDLSYGANHVLKDVNLHINPGEFFAFLGPSGCGKTTLLRLIAGFNRADRGDVLIGGADVSTLPPWKRDVGMVFQSYALWPHMSVAQNVAFGLEERKVPRDEIARRHGSPGGVVIGNRDRHAPSGPGMGHDLGRGLVAARRRRRMEMEVDCRRSGMAGQKRLGQLAKWKTAEEVIATDGH